MNDIRRWHSNKTQARSEEGTVILIAVKSAFDITSKFQVCNGFFCPDQRRTPPLECRFPEDAKRPCTPYILAFFDGRGVCHSRFDAVIPIWVTATLCLCRCFSGHSLITLRLSSPLVAPYGAVCHFGFLFGLQPNSRRSVVSSSSNIQKSVPITKYK